MNRRPQTRTSVGSPYGWHSERKDDCPLQRHSYPTKGRTCAAGKEPFLKAMQRQRDHQMVKNSQCVVGVSIQHSIVRLPVTWLWIFSHTGSLHVLFSDGSTH